MEIITDEKNRCLKLKGKLDALSSNDLDQALMAFADNDRDIILDLSECPYVSSAGIRVLLKAKKKLSAGQNELFLSGVAREVMQVLEIAGLKNVFSFVANVEVALAIIVSGKKEQSEITRITAGNHQLVYQPAGGVKPAGQFCREKVILSYHELGFAIGLGTLPAAENPESDFTDLFVVLENCAGFLPLDPSSDPDFRITSDPKKTGLPVCEALSFGHQPSGSLKLSEPGMLTFSQLSNAIRELRGNILQKNSAILLVLANLEKNNPSLSIALAHDEGLAALLKEHEMIRFQHFLSEDTGNKEFTGITFRMNELDLSAQEQAPGDLLRQHLTFENIKSVGPFNPGAFLENPVAWLFLADHFTDGRSERLIIETKPGFDLEPQRIFLTRLLYNDSSRLKIEPLHGGYSAQTYHVTSFDHEGRKMRPTVLKIAHRDLITRESERCQKYALPYIFNNCAVVLGAEHYGETMALRYNFVGIGGESSQLKWLTHYYLQSDIAFLEPLFDKVFLQILKPWYGQPVSKTIHPFKDHDPTFTFFPHIYKVVSDLFSISAEEKYLKIPEREQPILNPYWFLKHEFERRRNWSIEYFTGICHGDLNMQNILLDENMNVYLIDFSETKPRSVISDFARLEAIFMVDNAPVEDEKDMADYLDFMDLFYKGGQLSDLPEIKYQGKHHEKVIKNAALTLKMRKYALSSANGNPDPIPYYIALLEWVLPIVCYYSLPGYQKKLSLILSSILCEKVMAAE